MDHIASDGQDIPVPRFARRLQVQMAAAMVVGVLALFWLVPLAGHLLFPSPAPPPARPDDGTFQATDRQWATLRFETVRRQSFRNAVTTDGRIAIDDDLTTPVMSPLTGHITRVFAKVGDMVKPGTPLFAVAASEFVQGQSDLVSAKGTLAIAQAQLRQARDAEARQRDLYKHQGAALKDWQQSQTDLANAEAGLHNAESGLAAVRNRLRILGSPDGDVAGLAGAGVQSIHGEAIVRAPVAGVITQRLIGLGQNIGSVAGGGNATQAFTISDFRKVWLVGNLREEDAMSAHPGQDAEVSLLAQPGTVLRVRVSYVAPTLDPLSRRLTVRAELPNPDGRLKPEMYANFALLTGGARASLSVPDSAVIYEGNTAHVWVARPVGKRIALREVKAGADVDGRIEILAGLGEGESVVTAGALFIDRGAKAD